MYCETAWPQAKSVAGALHSGAFRNMASELTKMQLAPRRTREREEPRTVDQAAWLQAVPAELRDRLTELLVERHLRQGESVMEISDAVLGWYGVIEGFLSLEYGPVAGTATDSGLPQGGWFGEHLMLADQPSDCRLVAVVPSRIVFMPREKFQELLEFPEFCRFVLRVEAQRVAALRRRLAWPTRMGTNTRVALRIAEMFSSELLFGGDFRLDLTQARLSEFLRLSRQRTNSALNRLQAMGELALKYRSIRVHQPALLMRRALAGELE